MSNKTQLNQLSKREILESLFERQQQDNSTLNRLVLAVALAAGLDAKEVAKKFTDAVATGAFADEFNKTLHSEFEARASEKASLETESTSTEISSNTEVGTVSN